MTVVGLSFAERILQVEEVLLRHFWFGLVLMRYTVKGKKVKLEYIVCFDRCLTIVILVWLMSKNTRKANF